MAGVRGAVCLSISGKGKQKVYIFDPGHISKMATMAVYGKDLNKSSSSELQGHLP